MESDGGIASGDDGSGAEGGVLSAPREERITLAYQFLSDPRTRGIPIEKKIQYLESKDHSRDELEAAIARMDAEGNGLDDERTPLRGGGGGKGKGGPGVVTYPRSRISGAYICLSIVLLACVFGVFMLVDNHIFDNSSSSATETDEEEYVTPSVAPSVAPTSAVPTTYSYAYGVSAASHSHHSHARARALRDSGRPSAAALSFAHRGRDDGEDGVGGGGDDDALSYDYSLIDVEGSEGHGVGGAAAGGGGDNAVSAAADTDPAAAAARPRPPITADAAAAGIEEVESRLRRDPLSRGTYEPRIFSLPSEDSAGAPPQRAPREQRMGAPAALTSARAADETSGRARQLPVARLDDPSSSLGSSLGGRGTNAADAARRGDRARGSASHNATDRPRPSGLNGVAPHGDGALRGERPDGAPPPRHEADDASRPPSRPERFAPAAVAAPGKMPDGPHRARAVGAPPPTDVLAAEASRRSRRISSRPSGVP